MKIKLFRIYKDAESNSIIDHIGHLKVKHDQVNGWKIDYLTKNKSAHSPAFNPFKCEKILFGKNKKYIHLNQFISKDNNVLNII